MHQQPNVVRLPERLSGRPSAPYEKGVILHLSDQPTISGSMPIYLWPQKHTWIFCYNRYRLKYMVEPYANGQGKVTILYVSQQQQFVIEDGVTLNWHANGRLSRIGSIRRGRLHGVCMQDTIYATERLSNKAWTRKKNQIGGTVVSVAKEKQSEKAKSLQRHCAVRNWLLIQSPGLEYANWDGEEAEASVHHLGEHTIESLRPGQIVRIACLDDGPIKKPGYFRVDIPSGGVVIKHPCGESARFFRANGLALVVVTGAVEVQ